MTVPGRADARHNHARVLAAARETFAEQGPSATLDAVARRAGVGAGTVYRRFPSKEALLAAVVNDRLDRLVEELATPASADPGAAFLAAFERAVSQVALNKALCESMASAAGVSPGVHDRFLAALAPLLARAQRAGAVRPT